MIYFNFVLKIIIRRRLEACRPVRWMKITKRTEHKLRVVKRSPAVLDLRALSQVWSRSVFGFVSVCVAVRCHNGDADI